MNVHHHHYYAPQLPAQHCGCEPVAGNPTQKEAIEKLLTIIFGDKRSCLRESLKLAIVSVAVKQKRQPPLKEVMKFTLNTRQEIVLEVNPKSDGQVAEIDGKIHWEVLEGSTISLFPSENGTRCLIWPNGQRGANIVRISADADLGEGERRIETDIEIEIIGVEATILEPLAIGVPRARSEAPVAPPDVGSEPQPPEVPETPETPENPENPENPQNP